MPWCVWLPVLSLQIRERLRTTPVPPMQVQYQDWLTKSPLTPLVSRDQAIKTLNFAADQNLSVDRDRKPFLLNAGGPSGCGKTRLGYESVSRWQAIHSRQVGGQDGGRAFFIPLFIDLTNGLAFNKELDIGSASECLGARMAAKALNCSLQSVFDDNGGGLDGLYVRDVLESMVRRFVDQEGANPADRVLIAVHLDEYQDYLEMTKKREDVSSVQDFFKEILNDLRNLMREAVLPDKLGVKVAILPVITGTPYRAVDLLWTKCLQLAVLRTPNVELGGALSTVADVFACHDAFADRRDDIYELLASSPEASAALLAVRYRPRLIVLLANWACQQAKAQVAFFDLRGALAAVNWQSGLDAVQLNVKGAWDPSVGQVVARLSLLRVPVRFVFGEGEGPSSSSERAVDTAESRGEVELAMLPRGQQLPSGLPPDVASSAFRIVIVPWVQMVLWGVAEFLPPRVHEISRARWTSNEQELYVSCLTAARMTQWGLELKSRGGSVALADLFPGALGFSAARNLMCTPQSQTYNVYREKSKFLIGKQSQPGKELSILARELDGDELETRLLTDGVFLTREGTYTIDCRTSIPLANGAGQNVHIEIQTRQSEVGTSLSMRELLTFASNARRGVKKWATDGDVVILVLITTRPLTKDLRKELKGGSFFQRHPDLLVISEDQMASFLPPDLLRRALG